MSTGEGQRKNSKSQNQRNCYGENPKPPFTTLDLANRGQYGLSTVREFGVRVHVFAAHLIHGTSSYAIGGVSPVRVRSNRTGCTRTATPARLSSVFCWACSPFSGDLCLRTGSVSYWNRLGTVERRWLRILGLDSEPRTLTRMMTAGYALRLRSSSLSLESIL